MRINVGPQEVKAVIASLSLSHFPFLWKRQCVPKPSGEMQYFMAVAFL
jgi:hypothetical protein